MQRLAQFRSRRRAKARDGVDQVGVGIQQCLNAFGIRVSLERGKCRLVREFAPKEQPIVQLAIARRKRIDLGLRNRHELLSGPAADLLFGKPKVLEVLITGKIADLLPYDGEGFHSARPTTARKRKPRPRRRRKPGTAIGRRSDRMVLTLLAALAAVAACAGLASLALRYLRERDEHVRVRELFSRYVPGHVVDEILSKKQTSLWAKRHYATVLCVRIRNFDFFAEDLSAEQTLRHLNEFYAVAGRAIVRHGGVIERLHADGITAVFGVLTSDAFQEERALRAALRIVRLANAMNARWHEMGRRPFQVSAGVNSGNVVAGEVGFAQRREFAIVGNSAHVASRLQQVAEEINASILASAATYEPCAEFFTGVPAESLPLTGLRKLARAYIVRGLAKGGEEEPLRLAPEIPTLETVIAPEPSIAIEPQPPHFSGFDDLFPAMPAAPPVIGEYEDPQRSAEAQWRHLPEAPRRTDR